MKPFVLISVLALFLSPAAGWGVEKKQKGEQSEKKRETKQNVQQLQPKQGQKERRVDTFVDANKNGIDDRKEKSASGGEQKSAPKKEQDKEQGKQEKEKQAKEPEKTKPKR